MDPLIPTIVGAILALAGGFLSKFVEGRKDRKSLRCALAAEIRAFLSTLEREKLGGLFDETYVRIQEENRSPLFPAVFRTAYNTVFSSSAGNLGKLEPCLVTDLVDYYYSVQTLVELTEIFSANLQEIHERKADRDADEIKEQLEMLADIRKLAVQVRETAINLANRLENVDK
jgi:hypothetical protein